MENLEYIKENLPNVTKDAERRFNLLRSAVDYEKISTKLKSELISNILESSFSSVLDDVEDPKKDSMPDLMVNDKPLEIKTAKTTRKWRGGEYSKRESDYLMVSYDDSDDKLKWFFIYTYLTEDDWESSKSANYYATTVDLDHILDNTDYEILRGSWEKKRILRHLICA